MKLYMTDYAWSKLSVFDDRTKRSRYYSIKYQGVVYHLRLCLMTKSNTEAHEFYAFCIHRNGFNVLTMDIHVPKSIEDCDFRKVIENKMNDLVSVYVEGIQDGVIAKMDREEED